MLRSKDLEKKIQVKGSVTKKRGEGVCDKLSYEEQKVLYRENAFSFFANLAFL